MKHIPQQIHAAGGSGRAGCRILLHRLICPALILFLLTGPVVRGAWAGLGEMWQWRNPLPQGSGFKAMAESNGRLILTGRAGTIMTTSDGLNWTPRASGTRQFLRGVAASGATVVAVAKDGDIVTSTDGGLTWALCYKAPAGPYNSRTTEWNTVIRGGGVWIAAGSFIQYGESGDFVSRGGSVITSPDGLTWTIRTVPEAAYTDFRCLVWTGTRFVLGGTNTMNPGATVLATSEDGRDWTPRIFAEPNPFAPPGFDSLIWTGSRVMGVQTPLVFGSPDGITWTLATVDEPPGGVYGVFWTGTQILAWQQVNPGTPVLYTSVAGESWTPHTFGLNPFFSPSAVAEDGTTLVVTAEHGRIAVSKDSGGTWEEVNSGVAGNFNAVTRFAGRWVAAGGDGCLTSSTDGVTWTPASTGIVAHLAGIAWHDGMWVAVGREDVIPPGLTALRQYSILTSTDGVRWTDRSFGTVPEGNPGTPLYSVIRAGAQWVATALGVVLTSPDGITWEEHVVGAENLSVAWNGSRLVAVGRTVNDGRAENQVLLSDDGGVTWSTHSIGIRPLRGITWTGSQFIAVGHKGVIYTSPSGDESTWTYQPTGIDVQLAGVVADGEGAVAVGGNFILTSPDGVTWTGQAIPTTPWISLFSIIKAGPLYVATGYDGVVITSPDAVTWTVRDTGTTHELFAAAWDGRQLLAAGEAGAILASTADSGTVPWKGIVQRPGPGLTVRLTWPATTGRGYDIESATSMGSPWLPVPGSPRTATGSEEFIDFTEPNPSAVSKRFFRARQKPLNP